MAGEFNAYRGQLQTGKIDIAASGAVISGVAGQIIRVYALCFVTVSAITVIFKDGSTALTGAMTTASGVPICLDGLPMGHPRYTLTAGNDFTFTLSSGVQVSGNVWFSQITSTGQA